jgi:hypothetical protein
MHEFGSYLRDIVTMGILSVVEINIRLDCIDVQFLALLFFIHILNPKCQIKCSKVVFFSF